MSQLGTRNVAGESGTKYKFNIYTTTHSFPDSAGVYIFTKRTKKNDHYSYRYLYVGETSSFEDRITSSHSKWNDAKKKGMNCIFIHRMSGSTKSSRQEVEEDIIERWNPSLND